MSAHAPTSVVHTQPSAAPMHALVVATFLFAALAWLALQWLVRQGQFSIQQTEDWGHAFVVPIISGYAIWKHREIILRRPVVRFWPGLIPLLVGIAGYYLFVISQFSNHMFQGASLVLSIFGLVLLLLGPSMLVPLIFPIGFLLMSITISEQVMIKVTFILQNLAAQGAEIMLNVLGFLTTRTGNVLTITSSTGQQYPLNVAEACSGMRMVVAFIALGITVAFLSCNHWWQRIALLCTTIPIAILTNIVRVSVLGMLNIWAPDWAQGEAHVFIGTVLLVPALLVFLSISWILNRVVSQDPTTEAVHP